MFTKTKCSTYYRIETMDASHYVQAVRCDLTKGGDFLCEQNVSFRYYDCQLVIVFASALFSKEVFTSSQLHRSKKMKVCNASWASMVLDQLIFLIWSFDFVYSESSNRA